MKFIDKQMNLTGMDKPEKVELDQELMAEGLINRLGKDDN